MSVIIAPEHAVHLDQPVAAAEHSRASALVHGESSVGRSPGMVLRESTQRMGTTHLSMVKATGGKEPFYVLLGKWFDRQLVSSKVIELPPHLDIALPGGGTVSYDRAVFAHMIKGVPKQERANFVQNLPQIMAGRIAHGQQLMRDVLADVSVAPTQDAIADVMVFLDAKARAEGTVFDHGTYNVADPDGKLLAFFNSCPEKYLRDSSHMRSLQSAILPTGQMNVHRGIDIPSGAQGLPYAKTTLLFGAIPSQEVGQQRLFIKMEECGCRLSSLSAEKRLAGQDATGERPINWQTDLANSFGHLKDFIRTRFVSAPAARKERIPGKLLTEYSKICTRSRQDGYISEASLQRLMANSPANTSHGVHTIVANMRAAYTQAPAVEKIGLAATFRLITEALQQHLDELDGLDVRIGNEKIFSTEQLLQDFAPPQPPPAHGSKSTAVFLRDLATPMTDQLIASLQQPMIGQPTAFLQASSDLLTLFYHGGGGLQAMGDALDVTIRTSLSHVSDTDKRALYATLTSDAGRLQYAAASSLLMGMRFNAPGDIPIGSKIGGIAYHDFMLAALLKGLERELHIPAESSVTNDSAEEILQAQCMRDAQRQIAAAGSPAPGQAARASFPQHVSEQGLMFSINGEPCRDVATFEALVPQASVREALQALVSPTTVGFGQRLMDRIGLTPNVAGQASMVFRYSQEAGGGQGVLELEYSFPYSHLALPVDDVALQGTVAQKIRFTLDPQAVSADAALLDARAGTVSINWE